MRAGLRRATRQIGASILALGLSACEPSADVPSLESQSDWTSTELALLRSLSLSSLPDPPASPTNRVADDPRAAALGRRLFFDPGLSRDGSVSCASCHVPSLYFTDGRATSVGLGPSRRNAPTVVGSAYSPWQFWDGRRDSLWSQALAPLEASNEMGSSRLSVVRYVAQHEDYGEVFALLFGPAPRILERPDLARHASPFGDAAARAAWAALDASEREEIDSAFANVGKLIAAYERTLMPEPSRFDRYVESQLIGNVTSAAADLTSDEQAGLRLFIDGKKTQCLRCHNGPLFTNQSFHDIGTGRLGEVPDLGRFLGLQSLRLDVFNCLGRHSDAGPEACAALRFLDRRHDVQRSGAFKTPSLRDVGRTGPYFHGGSHASLIDVIDFYRSPPTVPPNELQPLRLDDTEARQLVAFLRSLSGGARESMSIPGRATY